MGTFTANFWRCSQRRRVLEMFTKTKVLVFHDLALWIGLEYLKKPTVLGQAITNLSFDEVVNQNLGCSGGKLWVSRPS